MPPRIRHFTALALALALAQAQASTAPATPPSDEVLQVLETVVVSGAQPGPGLWKVSRDGRVMWVLGTLWPLPKRMDWNTLEVERRIAVAGVVLLPPTVKIEAKGVALGGIFLLPSLMSARNNPGKEKLEDVLPPADYTRWLRLKATYLGRDRGVEKRRPLLAAMDLRDKALEANDLSQRDVVGPVVTRAAKRADVPLQRPRVVLVVEDPKAAVKQFAASPLDDLDCFRRTLDQVENDLDTLARRANAWALGDVAQLRALTYTDNAKACTEALLQSGLAQERGLTDLSARVQAAWLVEAEKALATHQESFAMLSMAQVLGPSGYLAKLQELGYDVQSPEDDAGDATDADAVAGAADDLDAASADPETGDADD